MVTKAPVSSLRGAPGVPFTWMVRDTIRAHGVRYACEFYYKWLPAWEARFFIRAALGV